MRRFRKIHIVGMAVGLCGLVFVGHHAGWWVALGAFLMIFGNNLERKA